MIRLNMLPDIKREYLHARRTEAKVIAGAGLVSLIAIALVVILGLWVYGAQSLQKTSLTSTISKNMRQLKDIKDIDKYVTIQNQLASIDSLHDSKAIYSRLFDILPALNPVAPNSVKISDLVLDASTTTLTFTGETASYTALETFRDTLQNASLTYTSDAANDSSTSATEGLFSKVTVDTQTISKNSSGQPVVSFTVSTTFNPKTFARSTKTVAVNVPNKETTQSKVDAPDVFGASTVQKENQ